MICLSVSLNRYEHNRNFFILPHARSLRHLLRVLQAQFMALLRYRRQGAPTSAAMRGVGVRAFRHQHLASALEISQRLISLAVRSKPTDSPVLPIKLLRSAFSSQPVSMSQPLRIFCVWSFMVFSSPLKSPEPLSQTTPSFAFIVGDASAT